MVQRHLTKNGRVWRLPGELRHPRVQVSHSTFSHLIALLYWVSHSWNVHCCPPKNNLQCIEEETDKRIGLFNTVEKVWNNGFVEKTVPEQNIGSLKDNNQSPDCNFTCWDGTLSPSRWITLVSCCADPCRRCMQQTLHRTQTWTTFSKRCSEGWLAKVSTANTVNNTAAALKRMYAYI